MSMKNKIKPPQIRLGRPVIETYVAVEDMYHIGPPISPFCQCGDRNKPETCYCAECGENQMLKDIAEHRFMTTLMEHPWNEE